VAPATGGRPVRDDTDDGVRHTGHHPVYQHRTSRAPRGHGLVTSPPVPIGPVLRPRGRHARPSRAGQPVLAGLLAASVGGGTLGLAATGAAADSPAPALLVAAEPSAAPVDVLADDRAFVRASRERTPPPPPEPPPPPPPPPPVLPGCEGEPATGYANGRLPDSALCALPGHRGQRLRADAARALVRLEAAYEAETGRDLCVGSTYRSYAEQARLRAQKGRIVAPAGTSNHGNGTAVDLCGGVERFGSAAHQWMRDNAGRFGWVLPGWARQGGSKPEPWHWEYRG
jgi:hypothetical protein